MRLIAALLVFTLYIPIVATGRPQVNEVVAPITGPYKFLQSDDYFQVLCASGDISVSVVGGYAIMKCTN